MEVLSGTNPFREAETQHAVARDVVLPAIEKLDQQEVSAPAGRSTAASADNEYERRAQRQTYSPSITHHHPHVGRRETCRDTRPVDFSFLRR